MMDIPKRISDILFGFGEICVDPETVNAVQYVVYKQISMLLVQSIKIAHKREKKEISVIDVIFVLRHYLYTLNKIVQYYYKEKQKEKVVKLENTDEKTINLENADVLKKNVDLNLSNVNDTDSSLDKKSLSEDNNEEKTVDSMTNSNSEELKTSTFFNIIRAIDELEIFLDDCNKKIVAARNLYTLNVETIMMTVDEYLKYKCLTFHDTDLLINIIQIFPLNIKYDIYAENLLLYLARETISCLLFRVYQRRYKKIHKLYKDNLLLDLFEVLDLKRDNPITVNEIEEVIAETTTWKKIKKWNEIPFMPSFDKFNGNFMLD